MMTKRTFEISEEALTFHEEAHHGRVESTETITLPLDRDAAAQLVCDLDAQFGLFAGAPKLLPRKVFDALPALMKMEVIREGYQMFDAHEDLQDDAMVFDITLRRPA